MKPTNRKQWFGSLLAASAILFFSFALAASADLPSEYGITKTASDAGLPTGQPNVATVTASIVNTILSIVGVLAVVLIVYAGFKWMTSQGNEEKIGEAKKLLVGAVIGLLIIFTAYAISFFIVSQLATATSAKSSSNQNQSSTPLCSQQSHGTCILSTSCPVGNDYGPYVDCTTPGYTCCDPGL